MSQFIVKKCLKESIFICFKGIRIFTKLGHFIIQKTDETFGNK